MSILTRDDLNSATWQRLETHLRARLASLREQNDHDAADVATYRRRGAIAEVKDLLALADPPAPTVKSIPFE